MRLNFKTLLPVLFVISFLFSSDTLLGQGKIVYDTIYSKALEGNLLGDSPKREMSIYLPPGYQDSNKRYPVVYFIHGYLTGRQDRVWFMPIIHADTIFDSLITIEKIEPFIAVMPDGDNKYEGSWYTSNPVSGDFEKYIVYEIPEFIEERYRVIPGREGRALTGHSMGGYGTAYLGTKYAQEYTAIGIMSGGMNICSEPRMKRVEERAVPVPSSWDELLSLNYRNKAIYSRSAAYSPNPLKPPFYVDVPVYIDENDSLVVRPEVWKRWIEFSPLQMIGSYQSNLRSLDGIIMTVGSDEGFASNDEYHAALFEYNIRHEYHIIFGDHVSVMAPSIKVIMRFFSKLLQHE